MEILKACQMVSVVHWFFGTMQTNKTLGLIRNRNLKILNSLNNRISVIKIKYICQIKKSTRAFKEVFYTAMGIRLSSRI